MAPIRRPPFDAGPSDSHSRRDAVPVCTTTKAIRHAFDYPTGVSRPLESLEPPDTDPFTKLPFDTLRRILLLAIDNYEDDYELPRDQFTYDYFGKDVYLNKSRRIRARALKTLCRTSVLFRMVAQTILYEHISIDTATYIFYMVRTLIRNADLTKHCKTFRFILPEFFAYKYPLPNFLCSGQIQLHEYSFLSKFEKLVHKEQQSASLAIDIHNRDYKLYNNMAALIWMLPNVEELSFPLPSMDDGLRRTAMLRALFRELDNCADRNSRFSRLRVLRLWAHHTDETFEPANDFSLHEILARSTIPLIETLDEFDVNVRSECRNERRETELCIGQPGYVSAIHEPNLLFGYGPLQGLTVDMCWDELDLTVRRGWLNSSFESRKLKFQSGINAIQACMMANKSTLERLRLRLNDAFIVDAYHSGETIKIDRIAEFPRLTLLEVDISILLGLTSTAEQKRPTLVLPPNLAELQLRCTSPLHLQERPLPEILRLVRQLLPVLKDYRKLGVVSIILDEDMLDLVPSDMRSMYKEFSGEGIDLNICANQVDRFPQPLRTRPPRIE